MKVCGNRRCEVSGPQPEENFNRNKRTKSGLHSSCKACRKHERVLRADKIKAAHARYYRENRDRILEYQRQYYLENGDKIKQRTAGWQAANRDRINIRFREKYRPDGRYREQDRAHSARRRLQLLGRPMDEITIAELYERCGGICRLCTEPVDRSIRWPDPLSASIDHIVPVSRGGTHEWFNVQLTHLRCNMRKGAK